MELENRQKGIVYMVLSCVWFALMQILVKLTGGRIPLFEQVFFRNLITLFICGYLCIKSGDKLLGHKKNQHLLIGRSLLGYIGVVTYFFAINHLDSADATILQKSSPIFVIIFAVVFLKEKLTKSKVINLVLCFIGTMFVVRPSFNMDFTPALVGMLSALFAGGAYTVLAHLNKYEKPNTIIFYFSLFSFLVSIPLMWKNFIIPTPRELVLLLGIGIFAGLGQIFLTQSYRIGEASEVSIFNYSTVVFTSILGFVLFGEIISPFSLLGILLIFSSSYYQYKKARKAR
ncbi:MAG: DMT family transporter [Lagierella massiliensis]|nr:DMT family transporter [Lagierella massiliensis]